MGGPKPSLAFHNEFVHIATTIAQFLELAVHVGVRHLPRHKLMPEPFYAIGNGQSHGSSSGLPALTLPKVPIWRSYASPPWTIFVIFYSAFFAHALFGNPGLLTVWRCILSSQFQLSLAFAATTCVSAHAGKKTAEKEKKNPKKR